MKTIAVPAFGEWPTEPTTAKPVDMKQLLKELELNSQNWAKMIKESCSTKWPETTDPVVDPEILENDRKFKCALVAKALEHYKVTKGDDLEMVQLVDCEITYQRFYNTYHITFEAKPKQGSISGHQLFFAEVYQLGFDMDELIAKMCMIIDPSSQDVTMGCNHPDSLDRIPHPRGVKFFGGPPGWTVETNGATGDHRLVRV